MIPTCDYLISDWDSDSESCGKVAAVSVVLGMGPKDPFNYCRVHYRMAHRFISKNETNWYDEGFAREYGVTPETGSDSGSSGRE